MLGRLSRTRSICHTHAPRGAPHRAPLHANRRVPRWGRTLHALGLVLAACGGRTDTRALCEIELHPTRPNVVLLLDHARTMATGGPGGASMWTEVLEASTLTWTRLGAEATLGAVVFPGPRPASVPTMDYGCYVPHAPTAWLHSTTASGARQALDALGAPRGERPIYEALRVAANELLRNGTSDTPSMIVLATGGVPACNAWIERPACTCTDGSQDCVHSPGSDRFDGWQVLCTDDRRVLELVGELRSNGIVTVVIGLGTGVAQSEHARRTLDAMAVAGGAPRAGEGRRYEEALDSRGIVDAIERHVQRAASCIQRAPMPIPEESGALLGAHGFHASLDPSGVSGWRRRERATDLVELSGPACDALHAAPQRLSIASAEVSCLR